MTFQGRATNKSMSMTRTFSKSICSNALSLVKTLKKRDSSMRLSVLKRWAAATCRRSDPIARCLTRPVNTPASMC